MSKDGTSVICRGPLSVFMSKTIEGHVRTRTYDTDSVLLVFIKYSYRSNNKFRKKYYPCYSLERAYLELYVRTLTRTLQPFDFQVIIEFTSKPFDSCLS